MINFNAEYIFAKNSRLDVLGQELGPSAFTIVTIRKTVKIQTQMSDIVVLKISIFVRIVSKLQLTRHFCVMIFVIAFIVMTKVIAMV